MVLVLTFMGLPAIAGASNFNEQRSQADNVCKTNPPPRRHLPLAGAQAYYPTLTLTNGNLLTLCQYIKGQAEFDFAFEINGSISSAYSAIIGRMA